MPSSPPSLSRFSLAAILGLALVLRVALALQGGQFFFPDESRFLRSILLYRSLAGGQWDLAAQALATSQHVGFTLVGACFAPFAHALAWLAGTGDWSKAVEIRASLPWIAAVLAFFPVLNVWLVHRLVSRSGGSPSEAGFAALLAAVAGSLFYQARHLLPYDCALSAVLAGLVVAASAATLIRYVLAGACAGAGVAIYNGYWFLAPVVGLALVARGASWPDRARALAGGAVGGALALGALLLPGAVVRGGAFWRDLAAFSHTVVQGVFAEGWSLPGEYLWHAEGPLGLAVLLVLLAGAARRGAFPARVRLWLGLAVFIWLLLALCSTGLEKFVVYGRTVRPLTLCGCLLGGHTLGRWLAGRPRWLPAVVAALLALAAINLVPHFRLVFPNEAKLAVWREHGAPKLAATFSGLFPDPPWPAVTRPDLALVNPLLLYPLRAPVAAPAGDVLVTWRHPHSLPAYQYEGHTPRERLLLRAHPPALQLIRLARPAASPDIPPVDFFFTPAELPDGHDHRRP